MANLTKEVLHDFISGNAKSEIIENEIYYSRKEVLELLNKIESLPTPKSDAVEFAEWISTSEFWQAEGDRLWWRQTRTGIESFTSAELYDLFQSQK